MSRWLERYQAGQHGQVWTEMASMGSGLRSDDEGWHTATAVARETMRRARENVERLVTELPKLGFQFEGEPFTPAAAGIAADLDRLEARVGVLPLSLRVWFEEVGLVNLNGSHPDWSFDYPDPLA